MKQTKILCFSCSLILTLTVISINGERDLSECAKNGATNGDYAIHPQWTGRVESNCQIRSCMPVNQLQGDYTIIQKQLWIDSPPTMIWKQDNVPPQIRNTLEKCESESRCTFRAPNRDFTVGSGDYVATATRRGKALQNCTIISCISVGNIYIRNVMTLTEFNPTYHYTSNDVPPAFQDALEKCFQEYENTNGWLERIKEGIELEKRLGEGYKKQIAETQKYTSQLKDQSFLNQQILETTKQLRGEINSDEGRIGEGYKKQIAETQKYISQLEDASSLNQEILKTTEQLRRETRSAIDEVKESSSRRQLRSKGALRLIH